MRQYAVRSKDWVLCVPGKDHKDAAVNAVLMRFKFSCGADGVYNHLTDLGSLVEVVEYGDTEPYYVSTQAVLEECEDRGFIEPIGTPP